MFTRLALLFCVVNVIACGDDGAPAQPDAPDAPAPAPSISSFTAASDLVARRGPATLTAVFENGTGVIDQSVGAAISGTSVTTGNLDVDTTFTLTVTGEDGSRVTATTRVEVVRDLWVADYGAGAVSRFLANQDGDVAPQARLAGATTGFATPSGVLLDGTTLYVSDQGNDKIFVFDNAYTLDGDVAPTRTIAGALTTLAEPRQMLRIGAELYVLQTGGIAVFPLTADGNVAPTRTITFPDGRPGCDMKLDNNLLYIASDTAELLVISPDDEGPADPVRTISGATSTLESIDGVAIVGNEVFVSEDGTSPNQITVFDKTASGDVAPLRAIAGAATTISYATRLATWDNQIYMADYDADAIVVFPTTATGDVAPARRLVGSATMLDGPWGIWLDPQ